MKLQTFKAEIKLRQKSMFAVQHLLAAARFSRQCGHVQKEHTGEALGSFYDEQIACTSASVMLCVASLESNINEYLENVSSLFSGLTAKQGDRFVELISTLSILEKYDRVLAIRGLEPFQKGERPYQDVSALISLRNEFVHFHPEYHDEQSRHQRLGKKLDNRFDLSPFISKETGVLFPQRIVSHGCTKWAVEESLKFMKIFEQRLGVSSKFERYLEKLKG